MDLSSFANSLNPSLTYGLTFVGDPVTHVAGIRIAGASTPYGDGSTFGHNAVFTYTDMTGAGFAAGSGFAFSAGALTPVPEASTVTVLLAAVFVAGLVAYRIRQRRQQTAAVVEACPLFLYANPHRNGAGFLWGHKKGADRVVRALSQCRSRRWASQWPFLPCLARKRAISGYALVGSP